jgi:hypothetical protein
MALFNWFGKKPEENVEMIPEVNNETQESVNDQDAPNNEEQKDEDKKRMITITWGTGLPIDIIYNYIHKDFEEEGYQDALINQDATYRDAKITIILNDLSMLFKRITLRYKTDIRRVKVMIENNRQAFALAAASDLEALLETYNEHLAEISKMESMMAANDPKMMTMIESYRRGFLKGNAAVTINFLNNNNK